jgi:hypothetical protein
MGHHKNFHLCDGRQCDGEENGGKVIFEGGGGVKVY